MEERYWFNCYKDDKKAGKGKTWKEILQYVYESIIVFDQSSLYWYERTPRTEAYLPERINKYFAGWRHSPKEGFWTEGKYDRIFLGWDENHNKVEINGDWHNPEWKAREIGTYLTDSYGRIIPSGYVKACYLQFKPDTSIKKRQRWYWHYIRGTGTGHVHCGYRYKGNHAGFKPWKRSYYANEVDKKEIFEEYGIHIKSQKIITYVPSRSEGKGWKRTKKTKQWM